MTRKTIFPGELFILEYVNGEFINKWAINASKEPIVLTKGRVATAGFTDVLVETENANLIDSRYHIQSNKEGISLVKDAGLDEIIFNDLQLKVLKVENQTEIFNRSGFSIGTIPKGSLIAIGEGEAGYSMRHLLAVTAYNDGSGWKFINQSSSSYGFVNVQNGFGLKNHDPKRNLVTAHSYNGSKIDWELLLQTVKEHNPKELLRHYVDTTIFSELREKVKFLFAQEDILNAELMDPVQFFANDVNRAYILERLYYMGVEGDSIYEEFAEAAGEFIGVRLPNSHQYELQRQYEFYQGCIKAAGNDPMAQKLCERYAVNIGG